MESMDLIQSFVEDCREHLDSIESWLMDIEAAGDQQNSDLVNSVFRLAHSIKGGAGMLGLDNIKTLGHKLENVLHMIRSRELLPTHDIINVLLQGFDRLTALVDNIEDSENMSIDAQVEQLMAIATGGAETSAKDLTPASFEVGAKGIFTVDALSLEQAKAGGNEIYLLEFDLLHDIHGKGKLPFEILKMLADTGRIVDCKVDFAAVGDLDAFGNSIPFYVLFATILEPKYVSGMVKLPDERMRHIDDAQDAVSVAPVTKAQETFGAVILDIDQGSGTVTLPAGMTGQVLADLQKALVAGLERCDSVALDWGRVANCDVFFYQLLLAAQKSYRAQGKRLGAAGPLAEDLQHAGVSQGFATGEPGCLIV